MGSIPLGSAEEVFRRVAAVLGDRLRRIPDGETGPRSDWIGWQYPVFSSRPQFEPGMPGASSSYRALPQLRLRSGVAADGLGFVELGYASAAMSSHQIYARLRDEGVIPAGCRFLVSLPTPLAPVSAFVAVEDQAAVEPAYERAMIRELARIAAEIPHDQLAIQWDTNLELGMLEGDVPAPFSNVRAGVLDRLLRLGRLVPVEVELGLHFCAGHDEQEPRHAPADAGAMVDLANALASGLGRRLDWLHVPIP